MIVTLGRFALERAANDLSHWQRYFPLSPPLFVSVNLSRRQLRDPGFEELLTETVHKNAVAQGTLTLEVTESATADDADISAILMRLRNVGASLAMDDFGTGTSSLSQFRNLPFDTVKIDGSFLARHTNGEMSEDAAGCCNPSSRSPMIWSGRWWWKGWKTRRMPAGWRRWVASSARVFISRPRSVRRCLVFIARHHDVAAETPS